MEQQATVDVKPILVRELWRERITEWSGSDETRRAYCRRKRLSYDCFQYWLRRIGVPSVKPLTFVRIDEKKRSSSSVITRHLDSDFTPLRLQTGEYNLEIGAGFSSEDLLVVLRVLRRV